MVNGFWVYASTWLCTQRVRPSVHEPDKHDHQSSRLLELPLQTWYNQHLTETPKQSSCCCENRTEMMTGTLSSTKVTDFPVIQEQGMKPVHCPAVGTSDITHRYISEQLTGGVNNEILPASQRTVFCSLCSLCKTTEESSDHHAPGRRMGALWLVFTSCFEKDGCFCSGWALGRMALYVSGTFFFLFDRIWYSSY